MKEAYPIILTPDNGGYTVYIPDFNVNTQGCDLTNAIEMARDSIGLLGIDLEDEKKEIPRPCQVDSLKLNNGEIASIVDVDFSEYRRKNELKTVKKNCTLPSWLCYEAEQAGLNFSQVLQNALKTELHLQ